MERDQDWDIVSVEDIADEFKMPFLADMIAYDEPVSVNMDHISGWFGSEGERFHFSPTVEFHPMEAKAGFRFLIFDVDLVEEGMESVSVFTFQRAETEPGYKVNLDDEGCILEERVMIPSDECDYDLESYPAGGIPGYNNNPWKTLEFDPTAE